MTVEELAKLLQKEPSKKELYVCHWARRAGRNIPIIFPLAELRHHRDGRLCLVEEDDRHLYNADR